MDKKCFDLRLTGSLDKLGLQTLLVDMTPSQLLALNGLIRGDDECNADDENDEEVAQAVEETTDMTMKTVLFLLCTSCIVSCNDQKTTDLHAAVTVSNDQVALVRGDQRWLLSNNIQVRTWGMSLFGVQQVGNLVSLVKKLDFVQSSPCHVLSC